MNIDKYLTFNVVWERFIGEDEDTHMSKYDTPVNIKCFTYGKNIFLRDDSSATTISAKAYLVLEDVKPKDKLDSQVVKSVNSYPQNWDNKKQLFEVLTWFD